MPNKVSSHQNTMIFKGGPSELGTEILQEY